VKLGFASFHFFGLTTGTARPRRPEALSLHPRVRSDEIGQCGRKCRSINPRRPPRKARLSASLTGMLSETGVPARLWRAPVPGKRRLSERVYSAMSSRIVSIWGFCLPRLVA
jgi:hypothetical protein